MTYRDDAAARAEHANALIDEIARLERQKLGLAATEQRLEEVRRELAALQVHPAAAPDRMPGPFTHLVVFAASAAVAYVGYTLLT